MKENILINLTNEVLLLSIPAYIYFLKKQDLKDF